uniref:Uncharacterized protein n=1 Tax=Oryza sativa subsp. japonica TaxID=39947 RepID=Q6ZGE5_ORYSJ|nr:hypothetical protein [Oryza sativa Japonica Group]
MGASRTPAVAWPRRGATASPGRISTTAWPPSAASPSGREGAAARRRFHRSCHRLRREGGEEGDQEEREDDGEEDMERMTTYLSKSTGGETIFRRSAEFHNSPGYNKNQG